MRTIKQLKLKVYGRVQGVSYRYFVKEKALELNLVGFVRNLSDGSVEIMAQGEEVSLQGLKEACLMGSSRAEVEGLDEKWSEVDNTNVFHDFVIRY